jgi:neurotransmitter:Na+ symporter, NSS family
MTDESPLLTSDGSRENWGSRAGFVLAAIGSAVGLGNLWGFPYKLYAYGGGAFLVPYIAAMLVIGIPILILEFSLGHLAQRAAPDAFARAGRRKEAVGWWGILLGFLIITYYPVVLAWCLGFFVQSVQGIVWNHGELPWAGMGPEGVQAAKTFFNGQFLNLWGADATGPGWALGSLQPGVVFALVLVWGLMFLCIFRGVNIVSKVVLWTVPLPWLMLLILTIRGLTLPGATGGLAYYLSPDWSELLKPTTWRFAFGQVFFSMSLAFGVMITYASFLHRKSDINNNAAIIGLGDLGTSFVAGIAVFATLGAMAFATQQAAVAQGDPSLAMGVRTVVDAGPGLTFVAFPYALAQLPHSAWFAMIFFFALITLGIDSAFSITESILASIVDKTGWNRTATLWGLSFVGLAAGLVYTSRGGMNWLGTIDGFVNGPWGIALLGLLECVVLGWMFRLSRLRLHANERSDWKLGVWWDWNIRIVVPVVLSALFVWSLFDALTAPGGFLFQAGTGELVVPVLVGLILVGVAPVLAVLLSLWRGRRSSDQPKLIRPDEPVAQRQKPMFAGALLGGLALAGLVVVMVLAIGAKLDMTRGTDFEHGMLAGLKSVTGFGFSGGVMFVAILATVFGCVAAVRAERTGGRPHWTGQIAGALGTTMFGGGLGAGLAIYVMLHPPDSGSQDTAGETVEMTGEGYLILGVMLLILVVGLAWCFYRAVKAAAAEADSEEQTSEI